MRGLAIQDLQSWGSVLGVRTVILERTMVGKSTQRLHSEPHLPTTSPMFLPSCPKENSPCRVPLMRRTEQWVIHGEVCRAAWGL